METTFKVFGEPIESKNEFDKPVLKIFLNEDLAFLQFGVAKARSFVKYIKFIKAFAEGNSIKSPVEDDMVQPEYLLKDCHPIIRIVTDKRKGIYFQFGSSKARAITANFNKIEAFALKYSMMSNQQ
jgi:hypothetical protein